MPNSSLVHPRTNVILRYGDVIDRATVRPEFIHVSGTISGRHAGTARLSDDQRTIVFVPTVPFDRDERVTVDIRDGVRTAGGNRVPPLSFSFTTSSTDPSKLKTYPRAETVQFSKSAQMSARRGNPPVSPRSAHSSFLPSDFPAIRILQNSTSSTDPVFMGSFSFGFGESTPYMMILNRDGSPMFYRRNVEAWDVTVQPNGYLTYYDVALGYYVALDASYQEVDQYMCGNGYTTDNHEVRVIEGNHAYLLSYDPQIVRMDTVVEGGNPEAVVIGLIIQEIDHNNDVVFQWRSWDHFQITDGTQEDFTGAVIDYVHGNSLEIDPDGNLLLSSRNMDEITKIDRTTGDIIWRLGGKNNQFTFVNDQSRFQNQHGIRRVSNGNILLFDNGVYREYSRVVEYSLDETAFTATLAWEYRHTPDIFGWALGFAQRLPDGNTFIGWGSANPSVTEVTPEGRTVFELDLPEAVFSYRAFSFPWKTTAFVPAEEVVTFPDVVVEESVSHELTIHNPSAHDITLTSFATRTPEFQVTTSVPLLIPSGGSAAVQVVFTPTAPGTFSDILELCSEDTMQGIIQKVTLTGSTGSPPNSGPTIITHPSNQLVTVGGTATFSVVATGTPPLSYQWQKSGAPIDGATGRSYTTPVVVKGDSGATFRCVVTNLFGTVTSNSATLTVGSPMAPTIGRHPSDQTVQLGQTAIFSVVASGTAPLSYQWQKYGVDIVGATNASCAIPAVVKADSGATFRCVVTNAVGSAISNSALLHVAGTAAPTISTHPADQLISIGEAATFSVVATGAGTLTYQWQKDGADIDGAIGASYTTPPTTMADSGALFRCIVSNASGSTLSNAARLIVNGPRTPVISHHPVDQIVGVGQMATFEVGDSGAGSITHQWQKDGADIGGATGTSYTTPATVLGDSGALFRCVVKNSFGSTTSNAAVLKVTTGSVSVLMNSGFQNGTDPWSFSTDGEGTFTVVPAGANNPHAARLSIAVQGPNNVQLYQNNVTLEAGAQYVLFFRGYSNTGHDVSVYLHKHLAPYTQYRLGGQAFDLDTTWRDFSVQFNPTGFTGIVTDARLRFWFTPFNTSGDVYYIDDVVLAKVTSIAPPGIATHPANASVPSGKSASFGVVTSGTPPFSYQWQKDSVDIAGANSALYTTPPTIAADNGAIFRCIVRNPIGETASRPANLIVIPDQTLTAPFLVSPANGVTVASTTQKFIWNKGTPNVTKYWFEIAADSFFTTQRTVDSSRTDTTKTVSTLVNGASYWWRVRAGNVDGWGPFSEVWRLRVSTTDVKDNKPTPTTYALEQNYPNPFNPKTVVSFQLPVVSRVRLVVYDLQGREVATLVNERKEPGRYQVTFYAAGLASGVYLYRIQTEAFQETKKLLLLD